MEKKLVVHIGLRKTGSSALQELLAKETELLNANGLDYPDRLTKFPAHQELAWSLMQPPPPYAPPELNRQMVFDHFCTKIDANIEAGRTTILSSEDLSLLTFSYEALSHMRERFGKYDPTIVFYARDPMSYHISNYKHALTAGRETRSFGDYLFNLRSLLFSDTKLIASVWSGVFGSENVRVLKYDMELFAKRSMFCRFLNNLFEVKVDDNYLSYRSNSGIPVEAVEFALALNRSDLPDEDIAQLKGKMRKLPMPGDDAAFLERHLTEDERKVVDRMMNI